jgi:hypothetical protein
MISGLMLLAMELPWLGFLANSLSDFPPGAKK